MLKIIFKLNILLISLACISTKSVVLTSRSRNNSTVQPTTTLTNDICDLQEISNSFNNARLNSYNKNTEYQKAAQYELNDQKYQALSIYKDLAQKGDSRSKLKIWEIIENNELICLSDEYELATKYFNELIQEEHPEALYISAKLNLKNNTISQLEAKNIMEIAAVKGHTESQFVIGNYYYKHNNQSKAFMFTQQAANNNHPNALNWLGFFYKSGYGIEKNSELAEQCFRKSSELGSEEAKYNLSILLLNNNDKEIRSKALQLLINSASKYPSAIGIITEFAEVENDPIAQYTLGQFYFYGQIVEQDYEKAVHFYYTASNQEHTQSIGKLGYCVLMGLGIAKDIVCGKQLLNIAKNKNDIWSANILNDLN